MQRERHPKSEITLIRKTGTSSSDFALGQFTRNYTQTTKRGLLTTNKG